MDVFDLSAKLSLNSTEYKKGLDDAKNEASGVGSKIGSGLASAAKIGAAAIGTAMTAAGAFAKSAIDAGQAFDASMSQVAAVSGATGDDFDALRQKAQEMGATTKFSASEAADAMNYMAMAGWKTNDMLSGISGIMDLAAASGESLATTSDIVTDALTAFGLTAKDSGRFADVLAAASSNANTNVSMMGETFKYVAPLAGALNFSTEDTATAIGLMANAGIKGSQAGTALRSILTRLAKPTKEAQTAMNVLGVSLQDEEGHTRSLSEVMDQMRVGFSNLQVSEENYESAMATLNKQLEAGVITQKDYDEQAAIWEARAHSSTEALQAQFAAMLGGQEALSGLLAIVNAAPEDYEGLTEAIYNSDGAAAKMAETMQNNLAGKITTFQSALEGAKIALSNELTPALSEFVEFGTESLSRLTIAFQEGGLSAAMEELGNVLSEGLAMITEKLPSFVDAGMQLLGALGQGIIDNTPLLIQTALDIVLMLGESIIENLPTLVDAAVELVTNLADWISEYADVLIESAVTLIITLFEALTNPDNISSLVDAAIFLVVSLAEAIIDNLPALIEKAPEIVQNLVDAIIENAPKLLEAAFELIVTIVEGIMNNLPQLLESATQIVFSIAEGIVQVLGELIKKGKEIVDSVKQGFDQKVEDAKKWGRDLIDNFIGGIKEKWENLKSTVRNVAQSVKDFLGFSKPKKGPLSDFDKYAPDMMDLFTKGIRDNTGKVKNAAESMADSVKKVFTGIGDKASEMSSQIADAMTSMSNTMHNAGQSIFSSLSSLGNASSNSGFSINYNNNTAPSWLGSGPDTETTADRIRSLGWRLPEDVISSSNYNTNNGSSAESKPINITVQSVLDGRVIGQTAYSYAQNRDSVLGVRRSLA